MPITTTHPYGGGYDPPPMALVKNFVHTNGKSVSMHVTSSGVTAYVADEIPLEALIAWEAKLSAELGLPIDKEERNHVPDANTGARGGPTG